MRLFSAEPKFLFSYLMGRNYIAVEAEKLFLLQWCLHKQTLKEEYLLGSDRSMKDVLRLYFYVGPGHYFSGPCIKYFWAQVLMGHGPRHSEQLGIFFSCLQAFS